MRILEISRCGFFKALHPETTWIRWGNALTVDEPHSPEIFSLSALAQILRSSIDEYDLIVVPAIHPDHRFEESWNKLAAKSALKMLAKSALLGSILSRVIGSARHVIVDIADNTHLCETTLRLFPRSTLYFKRELDLDHRTERHRLRPLPLFVPNEYRIPARRDKDIDVFFAGALCNEIRKDAVAAVKVLSTSGWRVITPEAPLPYEEYMDALARSWLVLSPEGYGWDCYRHYEAALAGSVAVISRPKYRRELFLQDGVHCIYYDSEHDPLATLLARYLADKPRLISMGKEARSHVLANHTRAAVARYMLRAIDEVAHPAPTPKRPGYLLKADDTVTEDR